MKIKSILGTKLFGGTLYLCLVLVLAFAKPTSAATIITQFGNDAGSSAGWYTPSTSTIDGNDGLASPPNEFPSVYQLWSANSFTIDLSQDPSIDLDNPNAIQVRLTGLFNSGDSGLQEFNIALVDVSSRYLYWTFNWSDFTTTSSSVVKSIDGGSAGAFDFTNIIAWELNSGTTGLAVNATFTKLEAIPEPSSVSLLMLGAAGLVALRRLRKV